MKITRENIHKINWNVVTIDDFRAITDEGLKVLVISTYHEWLRKQRELDKVRLFKED